MRYRSLPLLVAALLAPIPAHAQFLSAAVGRIQTVAHWMTGIDARQPWKGPTGSARETSILDKVPPMVA